jgi:hypothetical protein
VEGRKSQAPWINDPDAWGRIRLTERTWNVLYPAVKIYLDTLWKVHHGQPNPSPESRKSLQQIREIQKVLRSLEGLAEEKGWGDQNSG